MNFAKVFKPIVINSMELKNRLVVPAMGSNLANPDGTVSDRLMHYLVARAKGGFALITTEAVSVSPHAQALRFDLGIWDDKFIPGFKDLAKAIHAYGAKLAIQLYHPGRQTSRLLSSSVVAPSPIPCPICIDPPKELSVEEILEIEGQFVEGVRRAQEAEIDAVELHGAHGYLIAQFMSRYSNSRTDAYGGDIEGLLRFPVEIIRKIREKIGPKYPLIFRVSGDERVPGGRGIQETKVMVPILQRAGVDAFHVSTGVYGSVQYIVPPMAVPPGFNVNAAAEVKKVTSVPVISVGRIDDPYLAESILNEGLSDLIAMGRASLADPDLPEKMKEGNLQDIRLCIGCNQGCIDRVFKGESISCLVNPEVGREKEMALVPTLRKRKVLVVGGGPGGMEAARVAALRGHEVYLCEKENKLGGQLDLAAIPPCRQDIAKAVNFLAQHISKAGVKVNLNSEVNLELVAKLKPEVVIIATGGMPLIPDIPGIREKKVMTAFDILKGNVKPGRNILIIGGGSVGAEIADLLSPLRGRKVTLVEMLPEIARDLGDESRSFLLESLIQKNVKIITGAKIKSIEADGVIVERSGNEERLLGFQTIILSVGVSPVNDLAGKIKEKLNIEEVHIIGDAKEPRKAINAIAEGAEIGRKI